MKECPQCHTPMPETNEYCIKCGHKAGEDAVETLAGIMGIDLGEK